MNSFKRCARTILYYFLFVIWHLCAYGVFALWLAFNGVKMNIRKIKDVVFGLFSIKHALLINIRNTPGLSVPMRYLKQTICAYSVPAWHEWHNRELRASSHDFINHLNDLVTKQVQDPFYCYLSDIYGFSASKSELNKFTSTNDMVIKNSKEMLNDISETGLIKNLSHDEIRISITFDRPDEKQGVYLNRKKCVQDDFLREYEWGNRARYLINSGGSHHLSAAKLISGEIGQRVSVCTKLEKYCINYDALDALCNQYRMFLIGSEAVGEVRRNIRALGIKALFKELPRPYSRDDGQILFLENSKKSRILIDLLEECECWDFSWELKRLDRHLIREGALC